MSNPTLARFGIKTTATPAPTAPVQETAQVTNSVEAMEPVAPAPVASTPKRGRPAKAKAEVPTQPPVQAMTPVNTSSAMATVESFGSLPVFGALSIVKSAATSSSPIRFLKIESKRKEFIGCLTHGKDDRQTALPADMLLTPIAMHGWRQYSDSQMNQLCISPDGNEGVFTDDTTGALSTMKCAECEYRSELARAEKKDLTCKNAVTVFFLSNMDDFIYTYTFRDGFAMRSLASVVQGMWLKMGSEYTKHLSYAFYVPTIHAISKVEGIAEDKMNFAMLAIKGHLERFNDSTYNPEKE